MYRLYYINVPWTDCRQLNFSIIETTIQAQHVITITFTLVVIDCTTDEPKHPVRLVKGVMGLQILRILQIFNI